MTTDETPILSSVVTLSFPFSVGGSKNFAGSKNFTIFVLLIHLYYVGLQKWQTHRVG